MRIALRTATKADVSYVLRVEEVCMRHYAEALWGEWRPSATVQTFDPVDHYVMEREGAPVGCFAERWHPSYLQIGKLYVDSPFQRQGIGASVLEAKAREASAKGLPIKLSVIVTNPAFAFYLREGFEVESVTAERRWLSKQYPAIPA